MWRKRASKAKDALRLVLKDEEWYRGIGISNDGDEYALEVKVSSEEYAHEVPQYVGAIRVRVDVLGEVQLQNVRTEASGESSPPPSSLRKSLHLHSGGTTKIYVSQYIHMR